MNHTIHLKYKEEKAMALTINQHDFKGHKSLLGNKYVTYGELELSTRYNIFQKSTNGFDWGTPGSPSIQLAFAMLYQISNKEIAEENAIKFSNEIVSKFNARDWILSSHDVLKWIDDHCEQKPEPKEAVPSNIINKINPLKKTKKSKDNVVKKVCKELDITQKTLAGILEIPEGTVSSWAVKNEIPRLGKKAIEFYILSVKNQKIVESYRSFKELLEVS